jgi:Domain of unknown function (DUF1992)
MHIGSSVCPKTLLAACRKDLFLTIFSSVCGLTAGTPHDRAARNNKLRLSLAVSNSHDYMMEKQGLMSDEAGSNRLTQAKGLDAIVEDKIQMAIMRGDFDGLENKGKPLNIERNSLVNPAVEVSSIIKLYSQSIVLSLYNHYAHLLYVDTERLISCYSISGSISDSFA